MIEKNAPPPRLRFTAEDQRRANEDWGSNCGPGALAAVLGMTLDELRPSLGDFEKKRYTNPTLMWAILRGLDVRWRALPPPLTWPVFGLARVQWLGPWMNPAVPIAARYRHTHWVASCWRTPHDLGIFDINAMGSGGWIALKDWSNTLVPWLLAECEPKATGGCILTHAIEVERR